MNDQAPSVALHVWISGRVQGVFFRESTRRRSIALGLKGWVGNLPDGRVEGLFVGSRSACEQALEGTRVRDEENPFELVRIVRSFDPCLACAIHMVTPGGRDIGEFRVI